MFDQQNNFLLTFIDFNELFKQHANLHPVYYQLGFICSVQAQPEQLDLEQWLPYLWLEDADISFNDQQQAADYAKELLSLVAKIRLGKLRVYYSILSRIFNLKG